MSDLKQDQLCFQGFGNQEQIFTILESLYKGIPANYSIEMPKGLLSVFDSHFDHLIRKYGIRNVDFQYVVIECEREKEKEIPWKIQRVIRR